MLEAVLLVKIKEKPILISTIVIIHIHIELQGFYFDLYT